MKKVYLVIIIGFICVQHSFAGEWYQGGTLHKSTIGSWYKAPYQDRLATCSDWVVALVDREDHRILFTDNMKVLRSLSESLEKCITDGNMINGKILTPSVKSAERVSLCWEIMQNQSKADDGYGAD